MQLLFPAFAIALTSSALFAAPPAAAPAPAASAAAPAPSPERLDLARKFVKLSLSADQYVTMVRVVALQFAVDSDEESATAAKSRVDHALARLEPAMRAQLPKLFEAYAQAYAREFSDSELRDIIAFASTPGGKHYLAHREFVLGDPSVVQAQQDMNEAMKPALLELQKEACAEHTAQRIAAGDKTAKCPLADKADVKQG